MRNLIRTGMAAIALYAGFTGCTAQKQYQPEAYLISPVVAVQQPTEVKKVPVDEVDLAVLQMEMALRYTKPSQVKAAAVLDDLETISAEVKEALRECE